MNPLGDDEHSPLKAASTVAYGAALPVIVVAVGAGVSAVGYQFALLSARSDWLDGNVSAFRPGLVGTAALILLVGVWALAVQMRWVSPVSGTGLVLAGSGMAGFNLAYVFAYYAAYGIFAPHGHDAVPGADDLRLVGWVAYGCGVGITLAACVLGRRKASG